jgi:hypothetical protein
MADPQAEIQAAADEMVAAGTETGLQVAVHRHVPGVRLVSGQRRGEMAAVAFTGWTR